jgi:hypothetical protein
LLAYRWARVAAEDSGFRQDLVHGVPMALDQPIILALRRQAARALDSQRDTIPKSLRLSGSFHKYTNVF